MSRTTGFHARASVVPAAIALLLTGCASVPLKGAMSADRPGFVDLTSTVARGHVQTEGGYTSTQVATDRYESIGEGLVRYGFASRAELRVHTNSFARLVTPAGTSDSWEDMRIGTKVRLIDAPSAVSVIPSVSLIASSTAPTGGEGFGSQRWQPEVHIAAAWGLPAGFSLATNAMIGRINAAGAWHRRDAGGAALGFAATPKIAPYAGYYLWKVRDGVSSTARYIDGGFGILLTDNVQVDVRAGIGANHIDNDHFFGLGIARRW